MTETIDVNDRIDKESSDERFVTIEEQYTEFISDVVDEANADGVVVGLSGGIDSTVTTKLAIEALGTDAVYGLVLPAATSTDANTVDGQDVANKFGINFRTIDIQPIVDELTEAMTKDYWLRKVVPLSSDTRKILSDPVEDRDGYEMAVGNAAARIRMMALYFEANTRSQLVLGTGNRTELLLGYFTKYGDGGVDLLPIGDLYKTDVKRLAQYLDIPSEIIEKPPTAGLLEGQTDERELGAPYETIDAILRNIVDEGRSVERTANELEVDQSLVAHFAEMHRSSEHKRAPPPTPKTYQ